MGLSGKKTMGLLLCGCITCQMLISHMHRFNIYEIKQIDSWVILESMCVLLTVNSQQGRSRSALLQMSRSGICVHALCLGLWLVVLPPGQLKVKSEEKPGRHFGSWIEYSTVHIWWENKENSLKVTDWHTVLSLHWGHFSFMLLVPSLGLMICREQCMFPHTPLWLQ